MKTPHYSSRYIKTLYQEKLHESTPITLSLTPYDDLITFLKDLISDLILRRHIDREHILIITDTAWLKHAIKNCLESSFDTQIDHLYDHKILICDTQSASFNENFNQFSACIALNYLQIWENDPKILYKLIENSPNTLVIGIDDQSSNREFLMPRISEDERVVSYDPPSFKPFLKNGILIMINYIFDRYSNFPEILEASELIFGSLNEIDSEIIDLDHPYEIQIGTSSFVESEYDEESDNENEDDDDNDLKEFVIGIYFSKFQLDFSIEVEDADWDGTAFYNYTLNIEEDIEETISGDVDKFEELMDEVKDRLYRYRHAINFKFEGFDKIGT